MIFDPLFPSNDFDYDHLARTWDPWKPIPERYNLGTALTRGNVVAGRGEWVVRTREIQRAAGFIPAVPRHASSLAMQGMTRPTPSRNNRRDKPGGSRVGFK